jgi:hypothetical protein
MGLVCDVAFSYHRVDGTVDVTVGIAQTNIGGVRSKPFVGKTQIIEDLRAIVWCSHGVQGYQFRKDGARGVEQRLKIALRAYNDLPGILFASSNILLQVAPRPVQLYQKTRHSD